MASKLVVVLALVAAVHSSVVPLLRTDADYSSFAYDVADPNTGDFKSQAETRIGDTVRGQYSLLESDGTKRTVDYSAGDEGFNAVVRNDPAVITAPVVAAAPAVVAAEHAVVSAEAPAVVAARTVVASTPAVVASAPAVYASAPAVVARTVAAPAFYSAPGFYAPSVYAAGHLTSPLLARTVVAPGVVPSPYVKYW